MDDNLYAESLTPEWREAFENFYKTSEIKPFCQEDIDKGTMSEQEAWDWNINHLEEVATSCKNIETPEGE